MWWEIVQRKMFVKFVCNFDGQQLVLKYIIFYFFYIVQEKGKDMNVKIVRIKMKSLDIENIVFK